jgi:PAS domain S-box-containing protein
MSTLIDHLAESTNLCPLGLLLSERRSITWCNERFENLFGYVQGELIGQSLESLYPSPVEFQRIGDRGLRVMTVSGDYNDERLMKRKDGQLQWFRVHGHALDRQDPFLKASWVFEPLFAGREVERLAPREREVLSCIVRGQSAKECAKGLGISPRTVEKILALLRERFSVHNTVELIRRVGGLPP